MTVAYWMIGFSNEFERFIYFLLIVRKSLLPCSLVTRSAGWLNWSCWRVWLVRWQCCARTRPCLWAT